VPGFLRAAIHSWDATRLRLFLRLVTAKVAIPAGGRLRPPIRVVPVAPWEQLRTHTCFHTLDLPRFASQQQCADALETALLAADSELAD
jgi:hypothetical protein